MIPNLIRVKKNRDRNFLKKVYGLILKQNRMKQLTIDYEPRFRVESIVRSHPLIDLLTIKAPFVSRKITFGKMFSKK